MARRIESLFLSGPAGRLEALLEEPEDRGPLEAALVCHPHPLHGGTMHNKVVYRIARGLRRAGHTVLRFNFRGVNLSEGVHANGVGELDDARAALAELRSRYPELPFTLAGFSFGSRVCLRLAEDLPPARRLIAVGFPAQFPFAPGPNSPSVPRIFLHSRKDAICPPGPLEAFFQSLPGEKQLHWLDGQDHFFRGALDALEKTVRHAGSLQ